MNHGKAWNGDEAQWQQNRRARRRERERRTAERVREELEWRRAHHGSNDQSQVRALECGARRLFGVSHLNTASKNRFLQLSWWWDWTVSGWAPPVPAALVYPLVEHAWVCELCCTAALRQCSHVRARALETGLRVFQRHPVPRALLRFGVRGRFDPYGWRWSVRVAARIGRGESLRGWGGLEVPLTRAMRHHLVQSPDDLCGVDALRRAQILGFGGEERWVEDLAGTGLARFQRDGEPFWHRVIEWLVPRWDEAREAGLPRVLDGIQRMRGQGEVRLFGRSTRNVLRDALRRVEPEVASTHPLAPPSSLTLRPWRSRELGRWTFTELRTQADLDLEGLRMSHCAGTLGRQVGSGLYAIISLCDPTGPRGTILVDLRRRAILQARGPVNAMLAADADRAVRVLARRNDLQYG